MGEYTTFKKFYKPDRSELVDVDAHLNYNLKIMDAESLPVFGYVYTDEQSIGSSALKKQAGYHWYKSFSNAAFFYNAAGTTPVQDGTSNVADWTVFSNFLNGWTFGNDVGQDQRVKFRRVSGVSGAKNIQWEGSLIYTPGNIPTKVWTKIGNAPVAARPSDRTRYSCVIGAADVTFFIQGMFRIDTNGDMYFGLNGDLTGSPASNAYISLVGVQYDVP